MIAFSELFRPSYEIELLLAHADGASMSLTCSSGSLYSPIRFLQHVGVGLGAECQHIVLDLHREVAHSQHVYVRNLPILGNPLSPASYFIRQVNSAFLLGLRDAVAASHGNRASS